MIRTYNRLTDQMLKQAKAGQRLSDGDGLYFSVTHVGRGNWGFRYRWKGKDHEMGLGPYPSVSLSEARDRRDNARRKLRDGVDPLGARNAEPGTDSKLFRHWAEEYIARRTPNWTPKHAWRWQNCLEKHGVYKAVGSMSIEQIKVDDIHKILEPIWRTKTETARQLRARIAAIWRYGAVLTECERKNPAAWVDTLEMILPSPKEICPVQHYASLPYDEIVSFFVKLCEHTDIGALALQVTILTGVRTIMIRFAVWDEFDLRRAIWTIPKERVPKRINKEFRIPLSPPAIATLEQLQQLRRDNWVVPGLKRGRPISDMTMTKVLRRMGLDEITVHGFRSTLRTWGAEFGNFRQDIVEMALAHTTNAAAVSGVSAGLWETYQRGDLLDKRRELMNQWGNFVGGSNVISLLNAAE